MKWNRQFARNKALRAFRAYCLKWEAKAPRLIDVFSVTRRALILGGIASIALTGPAIARLHGGIAASGGGGGTVTLDTMTLKTKSGGNIAANQPLEFGLPIAPATVAQSDKIQILDASSAVLSIQEDNRIVDADGYVRWAKVTGIGGTAPGAASETLTIQKLSGSRNTSNPITTANLLAATIAGDTFEGLLTLTMPNGDVYTAKCTDGLNASTTWTYGSPWFNGYHRQGPLATEFVVMVPLTKTGVPHPYLYAEFHITAYKANPAAWNNSTNPITGVKVNLFVNNGFNGNVSGWSGTPADYCYDLTFSTGASSPVTQLSLTGGAQSGNLTLSASSGQTDATRASGTFGTSTSAPNSSDVGKAIVEVSGAGTGRAYMYGYNSTTNIFVNVPGGTPFSSTTVTSWKTMGVFHYYASRVSNTHPAIGGSWWGSNSDVVYPVLKTSYIKASQMMPNYYLTKTEAAAPSLTAVNRDGCHPCGMSAQAGKIKDYGMHEDSTGDVPHIGVMTYQQATACIWWDDTTNHANARTMLIANAEVGHRKPYWYLNEEYGTQNGIADAGIFQTEYLGTGKVVGAHPSGSSNWFVFAQNHSGQVSWLAYLMTGDLYHLQNQFALDNSYSMFSGGYGFFDQTSTSSTISGSTITGPGSLPHQTGEPVTIRSRTNSYPSVGGVALDDTNRFFYRAATGNTGSFYDTKAHALAGGGTGLVTFSAAGANVFLGNGYVRNALQPQVSGAQTRQASWAVRSCGQALALLPSSPVSNLLGADVTRSNMLRRFTSIMKYFDTNFTQNVSYQAGGPRFLWLHGGTNSGSWQINYMRMALLHLVEANIMGSGSTLNNFLDWILADAIQWHVRTTDSYPPSYCSNYYFVMSTSLANLATPAGYDYATIYNTAIGTPFNGGLAYGRYVIPAGFTATISSVAVPASVTVTLNKAFFDTSNKVPYEGKAWLVVGSGCGQIKTITSSTVCVIDCTVSSWYGQGTGNATPITGSGQSVVLPLPSPGNGASVVPSGDIQYFSSIGMGTNSIYGVADRTSLEIAHQRGIDLTNYAAAVSEMTNRSYPANLAAWGTGNIDEAVKFNLLSR